MNIIISNSADKPIYQQIVDQIKALIVGEELQAGDALPSMRLLAKELRISVITTKRAYEELEREGFINSMPGRGSFVASKNMEFVREEQMRQVENSLTEAAEAAKMCGIEQAEFLELAEMLYRGE